MRSIAVPIFLKSSGKKKSGETVETEQVRARESQGVSRNEVEAREWERTDVADNLGGVLQVSTRLCNPEDAADDRALEHVCLSTNGLERDAASPLVRDLRESHGRETEH